ncbi:YncE family protein [Embleya sp. NPDC050493]|uniref:YncE family protein n=1 Tax=Embleya sp. NPDC050493 TaxID=3363989 RepID=UPI0037924026
MATNANVRRLETDPTGPLVDPPFALEVTPVTGDVFVAHPNDNFVSVVDPGAPTATTITVGNNPAGTAFSPDGATAHVTNINSDTLSA